MTPTQEYLLKLVLEIDEICKKYDIEFFLEYGTMLGAVRHEGFIPWDNDLDIAMTEENYDKFVIACQKELDNKTRTFCDNRRDRSFPQVFGHYIDLTTCRMSKKNNYWEQYNGQWIDVFCMLELPGDEKKKEEAVNRYFAYDEFVNESFRHYRWKSDEIMRLLEDYDMDSHIIRKERVMQKLEEKIFGHHYDDCETYMVTSARAGSPTPFVPKKAYDVPLKVPFEGHEFLIPSDYVEVLTLYYGDNFNLFPKNQRIHTEMSHSGIPGNIYVDDFIRVVDKEALVRERKENKDALLEEGYRLAKLNNKFLRAEALKVKWDIDRRIREENIDVDALLASGKREDLAILDDLFDEYFTKQLHSQSRYWRVHFDIGDDLEYAALYTLFMYRNARGSIDKMFLLRKQNHLPLTDKMKSLKDSMQRIRNIKKYMLYGKYDLAKENLDWCLEHFPDSKEIRIWEVRYLAQAAQTQEELKQCDQLADQLLAVYPKNDYCIKAKGDVCWKSGDYDKAKEYYQALKEKTNDGLILLDIKKKENGKVNA